MNTFEAVHRELYKRKPRTQRYDNPERKRLPGRKRYDKPKPRLPIIALDGEGVTDGNGDHHYTLFQSSIDNRYLSANDLPTLDIFKFLLGLSKDHHAIFCMFSFNYDVCCWLRDLPFTSLKFLHETGKCTWKGYRIRYTPSKEFFLYGVAGEFIHIYDVFGFYQQSFVSALQDWGVGDTATVNRILAMKNKRSTFSTDEEAQIQAYCIEECQLLVQLVDKLRDAFDLADIKVRALYGAGAIAAALLTKFKVKPFLNPELDEGKALPVLSAYFGGRSEISATGFFDNVHSYDINSAYPAAIQSLPCLAHSRWEHRTTYTGESGIWYCKFSIPESELWPPFPVRDKHGCIWYPTKGEGYYWTSEVNAAIARFGDAITVVRGDALLTECDHVPYAWLPELYELRARYKREGNPGQKVLKLGYNSLYGKCAQAVGFNNQRPAFQSFIWAGIITAYCRSKISAAIAQSPTDILSVATDGILSRVPLNLPISGKLGDWEYNQLERAFLVQPGVYQTWYDGGHSTTKNRGFSKRDVSYDDIAQEYAKHPHYGQYHYETTSFIGLGSAIHRKEFRKAFAHWVSYRRVINFNPSHRFVDDSGALPIRHYPPTTAPQVKSQPYNKLLSWSDKLKLPGALEFIEELEQP